MSDLDTLILMFQTQLSDVMETVLKTAMHEVTRLVENGFVEEVRRRNQDVETLRTQLQWAEEKLSEADEGEMGRQNVRCVDCGKAVCSEGTSDAAEESGTELEYGVLMGCGMKQEDDVMELCTRIHGQEVVSELAQEADVPVLILSPVRESVTTEQDDVRPVVDVKKEEVNEPSCYVEHSGDWVVGHDDQSPPRETYRTQEREAKFKPQEPALLTRCKTDPSPRPRHEEQTQQGTYQTTGRTVMETLDEIQLRLQDITAVVHNIEAGIGRGRRPHLPSEEVTDVQLPLQSLGDFETLEEKLHNATTKSMLVSKLSPTGGETLKKTVWRICTKVFAPQLAVQLNWCGRGAKRGVRQTRVKDLIVSSAMQNETGTTSEANTEKVLQEWLRLAADRLTRRRR